MTKKNESPVMPIEVDDFFKVIGLAFLLGFLFGLVF